VGGVLAPALRHGAATVSVVLAAAGAAHAMPVPIPEPLEAALPRFEGAPATAQPLTVKAPLQHPWMAPNGASGPHLDSFNTGASDHPGPLGHETQKTSALQGGECAAIAFDSRGRALTVCGGPSGRTLRLLDPRTLDTIAEHALPGPPPADGNDSSGGVHFYLGRGDRAVVPTSRRTLQVVAIEPGGLRLEREIDLQTIVAANDVPLAVLPDISGRDWVVTTRGRVVTVDRTGANLRAIALAEGVGNDLAVGRSGAYVVSDGALYRLRAGRDGTPRIIWRRQYRNAGARKPGQLRAGSGSAPVLLPGGLVAIVDNDDPVAVEVLRTGRRVRRRRVCRVPVFAPGASAVEASLVAVGRSLLVTNNHGYSGPLTVEGGRTTTAGMARIDVLRRGRGCRVRWVSDEISPSAQPTVSRTTGLLYALAKPPRFPDGWYLAGIDFRSGKTLFRTLAGEGLGHNPDFSPIVLGPSGAAYVGTLGGIIALRDRL
jgi:hypothetical protein